jgi:hypothetical protein
MAMAIAMACFSTYPLVYTIILFLCNLAMFARLSSKQQSSIDAWPTSIGWVNRTFRIGFCFTTICCVAAIVTVAVNDKTSFFPLFVLVALSTLLAAVECIQHLRRREGGGKRQRKYGSALLKRTAESVQREVKITEVVGQNGGRFLMLAQHLRKEKWEGHDSPLPTVFRAFVFVRDLCVSEFGSDLDKEETQESVCELSVGIITAASLRVVDLAEFRDDIEEVLELHGHDLLDLLAKQHVKRCLDAVLLPDLEAQLVSCAGLIQAKCNFGVQRHCAKHRNYARMPRELILSKLAQVCANFMQDITTDDNFRQEERILEAMECRVH